MPLAFALSAVTVKLPLTMVPVVSSATKVVSTVWFAPLITAVTLVFPAVTLVRVVTATPFSLVITAASIIDAPLLAEKLTSTFGTVLPLASVTFA